MPLYDDFPYTNFHSLNLDWIVKKLSELENGESSEEETTSTATLARNLSGNYPYTNFHSLNLDWIIRSMFELESGFETVENEWQNLRATVLLNDEIKNAILQCFENVAWVNEQGQQYYNALHDLFFPPVIVDTLTAVLDQGERVFRTGEDVNVIKNYLTVTAKLTDGTLVTVPSTQYILTGSLSQEGPNIITVTYMNASASITVNAVAISLVSISAVYTQSGTVYNTDTLDSLKSDLVVTATYSDSSTATVPSADYTLSGTLTAGTSTITVTYQELTTTFNVTVSSEIPSQYTWLYNADSGEKLSEQDYVTVTSTGTTSETLSNGELICHVDNNGTETSGNSNLLTFAFTDTTSNDAVITAKAKLVDLPLADDQGTPIGQRFQLSNGTSGSAMYFLNRSGKIEVQYNEGTTTQTYATDYNVNEYHIFETRLSNGHQILKINGVQVVDTSTLSTSYATANMVRLQASNTTRCPNGVTTHFKWIAYYEES